jgi:acyl-CoA reductase-like NAD-dependent aldehyde dehydrogenase
VAEALMSDAIRVQSPVDGRWLGDYPVTDPSRIADMVSEGRSAARSWSALTPEERSRKLAPLKAAIMRRVDELCDCLVETCGKVKTEALLSEIYPVLDMAAYYQQHAASILREKPVATSPLRFPAATASICYRPYGVVAVIAPWNFPFQLSLIPMLTALHAGNAVMLKPSELCMPVTGQIMSLMAELDLPENLVQCVTGGPVQGEQLVDAGPDLVFFTGGLAGGRAVMARAAQHPIPVMLELGGKDAMIVLEDADLERACRAALYGAFCNSGQVCVSVERLYVHHSIYQRFLAMLQQNLDTIRVGHGKDGGDMGIMTSLAQFAILESQYQDALAQGAMASGPMERMGHKVSPVLLWHVNHDMRIMREESFGPVLPVMPFESDADAVRLANDSYLGLNASIWSRDESRALAIAHTLETGNWAINDVLKNVGHPALPFGGVKQSGFGRYHGAEGLLAFSQSVSGLISRNPCVTEPNWFPYPPDSYAVFRGFLDFCHGASCLPIRLLRNFSAVRSLMAYASFSYRQFFQNISSWIRIR